MKIGRLEIKLHPKKQEEEPSALDRLKQACDDMNEAWKDLRFLEMNRRIRPWIIWDEYRIVITEYNHQPEIIHE